MSMEGQHVIFHHIIVKRGLSTTTLNQLQGKKTGLNRIHLHRIKKRSAEGPQNSTDQIVFSFLLKKNECVEVKFYFKI